MSNPVEFEGLGNCFYTVEGFRPVKAGEFYLSGAIVQAWRAKGDISTAYHVVTPTFRAVRRVVFATGPLVSIRKGLS